MTPEGNLIKLIISKTVNAEEEKIEKLLSSYPINWTRFKELLIYHELIPFAYIVLRDYSSYLSDNLKQLLKNNYYHTIIRSLRYWHEFLRISAAFGQAEIPLVPIKGIAFLGDIYKDKFFRPMVDIDLLVKEEDLQKAEKKLCNLGYRKELRGLKEEYWRRSQCHIPFYKKRGKSLLSLELHWGLDFKRRGHTLLPEFWERVREVDVDGRTIKLLSPEDTLFSLVLHARRFGKTLCLKNIYDIILLLHKYAATFDWNYCINQSKKYGICSTLFFALYQVRLLTAVNIPKCVWMGLNIPSWKKSIVRRFIEKNTFLTRQNSIDKNLYLKSHFLLYDSLWEPVNYILHIPKVQFAKFYELEPYGKKTGFFYRLRFFYIFFKSVSMVKCSKVPLVRQKKVKIYENRIH